MSNNDGVVTVRFRPNQIATIREAAAQVHSTVGEYIKAAVLDKQLSRRIEEVPGAVVKRMPNGAVLTMWSNFRWPG